MDKTTYKFSAASTDFYFQSKLSDLKKIVGQKNSIIITDDNVFNAHTSSFRNWNTIVLKPGEDYKQQQTIDSVITQLVAFEADRTTTVIGVGGGVITDITGYVASIYMRGLRFGFVPSTVLAMVDAAIGGKNGINHGPYKNMVGLISQPAFIVYDLNLLKTLPTNEWQNGFAEVIKHASIKDASMFKELEGNSLQSYQKETGLLKDLIRRNAAIKINIVQKDEFEKGERKLLNFGHTLGHALETQYDLTHGQAISIGMTYASEISSQLTPFKDVDRLTSLLEQYELPTYANFNKNKVLDIMKMDKKKERKEINYVLLERVGKGVVKAISIKQLETIIRELE